jgi:hypothetical protein
VQLDYPKTYEEDYLKMVDAYCLKNYTRAQVLVNQKKYGEALSNLKNVERYNTAYKSTKQLSIIATCEPLYQSAITHLENKNYAAALSLLQTISNKTENYKDSRDLLELATKQQQRSFILFEPNPSADNVERDMEETLYNNFSQLALQKLTHLKIINNTPFQNTLGSSTDLNNATNVDLIQAIRKATGADYFYVFDVTNKKEYNSGISKSVARGYQEIKTRVNDTLIITEYKAFDYNVVKSQRSYAYDFKYKVINANTNQIVSSQTQNLRSQDAIEYQEFQNSFTGNINTLFPYNPQQTASNLQYNPRSWRNMFSARNTLKLMEELKSDVYNQNNIIFVNSTTTMK